MRYLIVSDIHSNWQALQAVLRQAEGRWDQALCCGDLVGYGADPNPVTDWVRGHSAYTVRGNHDKISLDAEDLEWFNPVARAASVWTMAQLSQVNFDYLRSLPAGPLRVDGFQLIHGSPLDEDEYLISAADVRNVSDYLEAGVSFFGHTHLQCGYSWAEGYLQVMRQLDPFDAEIRHRLVRNGVYLINAGSVGQPRDGDWRAAFALFDTEAKIVHFHRTPYNLKEAQDRIFEAKLPPRLATRLASGR